MIAIEVISADGSVVDRRLYPATERLDARRWVDDFLDHHAGMATIWAEDQDEEEERQAADAQAEAATASL
jgi:hypothetical protein